jgi:hypothetical protein
VSATRRSPTPVSRNTPTVIDIIVNLLVTASVAPRHDRQQGYRTRPDRAIRPWVPARTPAWDGRRGT